MNTAIVWSQEETIMKTDLIQMLEKIPGLNLMVYGIGIQNTKDSLITLLHGNRYLSHIIRIRRYEMIDEKKLIETINEIPKVWNGKECLVNVNKVIKYINDQPKIEKWILCDKPPKNDNKVLIFNGKDYSVGYYDGKHWINSIHPVKWAPIEL